GSEPYTQILGTQVGMQTLGEFLVLARIADEAGIEFNCLADQRSCIGDELLGHTGTAKEGFWNVALRLIYRVNSNGRRSLMNACVQTLYIAQIDVRKNRVRD